jgi:hypothetical protein
MGDEFKDEREVGGDGPDSAATASEGEEGRRMGEHLKAVGSDVTSFSSVGVRSEGVDGWRRVEIFRMGVGRQGLVSNGGSAGFRFLAPVYSGEWERSPEVLRAEASVWLASSCVSSLKEAVRESSES